ncbi:MAG TPA: hypothetical protein VLJ15_03250 [Gammaproteobacteria bacterium]|nr:hypothetical protein [Gammaproteobacteria bacterium]
MKKMATLFLTASCLFLAACGNNTEQGKSSANPAMAKNKVVFKLPTSQRWVLVNVEQDANGYARSYRSMFAKGLSADQSLYINYGRNIKTPLTQSMHEVVNSLASTGCEKTASKIEKTGQNRLVFTATADQCPNGRPVSQVFKVFNTADGQYSIVYSANPKVVPVRYRQQMRQVVMNATLAPM